MKKKLSTPQTTLFHIHLTTQLIHPISRLAFRGCCFSVCCRSGTISTLPLLAFLTDNCANLDANRLYNYSFKMTYQDCSHLEKALILKKQFSQLIKE